MSLKKLLTVFFLLVAFTASTQFMLEPIHKDTIRLMCQANGGAVQWQLSSDSINWQDIPGAQDSSYIHVVNTLELPVYIRSRIQEEQCDPYFSSTIQLASEIPSYYWSDNDAWNSGMKPQDGELAQIPENRRILLDENTAQLSGLEIRGILEFMHRDLELQSDYVLVQGRLQIGSNEIPFAEQALITLTGSDSEQSIMDMGTRGILVMGGQLELHGTPPQQVWTKIAAHANAGSTQIELIEATDWSVGDQIVLGPTDYYEAANGNSVSQRLTLTNIANNQLQFSEALLAHRWGLLQYAGSNGISLDSNQLISPPIPDTDSTHTPRILDERAVVGHLSRNIVIQAPDDSLWQEQAFGAHIMIMGSNAQARFDGVEIRRGGQRGRIRRYPVHWHMLSYSGPQTLGDAEGQYIRNSVINESRNRGIVIHGTNGLEVRKNVIYHVEGHGIFTEDAVERRNLIDSNLVLHVRNPNLPQNLALKQHEVGQRGASGFWISNPDNTVTNNHAADCGTNGFWLTFPNQPWGESTQVLAEDGFIINPSRLRFGRFSHNTAQSNRLEGIMLDNVEIDSLGNTYPYQYISTTDGRDIQYPFPTLLRFSLSNLSLWKNGSNGIWDRSVWPDNSEIISADNCGRFFAGSGSGGVIERCLVIGTSLNHLMNGTDRPAEADFSAGHANSHPVAFATYHSTFDIQNNLVYHFPALVQTRSGVFSTDDYYIRPVEKGQIRNTNNVIIDCHPGVKLMPPYNYFTLASALWDPHGNWGPDSNYFVYDTPFLTHGKTVTQVAPGVNVSGGVSVPGPFYGFEGFVLHGVGNTAPQNQPFFDLMGIHVRRLDSTFQEIATWTVPEALPEYTFQHMRDFATSPDSYYELSFPEEDSLPTNFQMNVENMLDTNDTQVIAIQFNGNLNPIVLMQAYGSYEVYQQANDLQEVLQSNGARFWQDKVNNLVWIKLRGGVWEFWTNNPDEAVPTEDELLYETCVLRIYEP
ncbi:MAG: hypothetical protein EP338_11905 [Bacteroidetes bacterium]|nr:MAG: hypothetical protein EP338_11905 [Bacteroidota bacterium]